jgi:dihydroorotate dehydrogenase electron transfer subunit
MSRDHRNTIYVEDAELIQHLAYPSEQFVMRIHAPKCAKHARPGSFVHIRCDAENLMRRPFSIMRVNAEDGWIEVLYKIVGTGTRILSETMSGDKLNILGPIGNGFHADPERPMAVLIGGGVGIPPLIFLAQRLHERFYTAETWHETMDNALQPVAFFGSEIPFPFLLQKSELALNAGAPSVTTSLSLLDEWQIPSRLASMAGLSGCHTGFVTDLARQWLKPLHAEKLSKTTIYACGPEPMLRATGKLAREFAIPSQLCLEEFMACGVGGCAGCAVRIATDNGPAMRRVCVDGPVFAGESVYPGRV